MIRYVMSGVIMLIFLGLLGLGMWRAHWFARWCRYGESVLGQVARFPRLSVLLVGLLSLAINAGITLAIGKSSPHIHDEFANLLAADTFLQGRLSNQAHPLWPFFESIHVLAQPVYASKYPPAQGLMLAVGQGLAGEPVVGMWLSVALACAAIYWALKAWMPPRWALLGGLLAALHPVLLKWSQVYWGGAEAMLGGALLVGAFRRIIKGPTTGDACWLALGMVILAISRPFEGMVLSLILLGALAVWLVRNRDTLELPDLKRLFVPVTFIMGFFIGGQALYNGLITGDPLKLPYMVYEEQYAVAPFLVWQKPRPESKYHHPLIRNHFVDYALREYRAQQTLTGFAKESFNKVKRLARDYTLKYVLVIPLLALPWIWRQGGWNRFALVAFGLFGLVVIQETWMWDRYVAPIGGLFFVVVMLGLRQMSLWQCCQKPAGRVVLVLVLLACLGQSALWLKRRHWEHARHDWDWQRLQMIQDLKQRGRKHLIIVRYGPKQSVHDDWVHNDAAIDQSPVVWARDMGPEKNRELLDYFKGRQVWLLESELPPAEIRDQMKEPPKHKLIPYRASQTPK
jgi:hypothetical protein